MTFTELKLLLNGVTLNLIFLYRSWNYQWFLGNISQYNICLIMRMKFKSLGMTVCFMAVSFFKLPLYWKLMCACPSLSNQSFIASVFVLVHLVNLTKLDDAWWWLLTIHKWCPFYNIFLTCFQVSHWTWIRYILKLLYRYICKILFYSCFKFAGLSEDVEQKIWKLLFNDDNSLCFSCMQWKVLRNHLDEIDSAVKENS